MVLFPFQLNQRTDGERAIRIRVTINFLIIISETYSGTYEIKAQTRHKTEPVSNFLQSRAQLELLIRNRKLVRILSVHLIYSPVSEQLFDFRPVKVPNAPAKLAARLQASENAPRLENKYESQYDLPKVEK